MIIILFIFFIGLIIFKLYDKRFTNVYPLNLLFGQKGAGKSTLMAKLMLKYQSKGWTIYTDLEGVIIPGVRLIDIRDLSKFSPDPKSAIFLDEIGLSQNNRDFKYFDKGLREFYAKQRHFQCVVWCNSQSFDCDKFIRNRTENLYFVQKLAGCISLARPIVEKQKPNDMSSPTNDNPVLQYYKWGKLIDWKVTFLPRYIHLFDSFSVPDRADLPYTSIAGEPIQGRRAARLFLRNLNRDARKNRQQLRLIQRENRRAERIKK